MKKLIIAILALLMSVVAQANNTGIINPLDRGKVGTNDGIFNPNLTSGGGVVTPCVQTGLIFTTGCNLILYVVVLL